ncbi:Unc104-like kinesin [Novymonas esmeraldas]|uniref:Unc104-like kinesin n=1 Tax=Novymonas esmeraldas TaxID=1808958 RepID=A0AAW0EVD4_9TRYP
MSVKVAVRSRPMSDYELKANAEVIIGMNGGEVEVRESIDGYGGKFCYDSAIWSTGQSVEGSSNAEASQEHVYTAIGAEMLEHIMTGYNGCIFAYGQTGSGKTYCMLGRDDDDPGLIPRIAQNLFAQSAALRLQDIEVCVEVSYYEIYNEKVRCLLRPTQGGYDDTPLRVREHPKYGPFIEGLAKFVVSSQAEFLSLMNDGNKVRTTASTAMNATSSRSHAVFAITLTQKQQKGALVTQKTSRLNLVDLAGSERASKTLATGKRLAEGANINKSLTCLGNVISALAEAEESGKSRHIPYRDSTLTWILKDNLGGNSKTVMLATISPSSMQYEETMSTLRYAERAKKIVNKAVVNETNNNELVAALQKEISALRSQLASASAAERGRLQEELDASEAVKKELTSSLEEKLAHTKKLMEEREAYMRQLESKLSAQSEEIEKLRNANAEKERRITELLQRIEGLAISGVSPDTEKVEQIREQVAALEQEQHVVETHMKEQQQQQQQQTVCGSLEGSEEDAEMPPIGGGDAPGRRGPAGAPPTAIHDGGAGAGLPAAVRAAFQKSRSSSVAHVDPHISIFDEADNDLVLESRAESVDEDLVLAEEAPQPSASADSDLDDAALSEDSDLDLVPRSPAAATRGAGDDEPHAAVDIVLDESLSDPAESSSTPAPPPPLLPPMATRSTSQGGVDSELGTPEEGTAAAAAATTVPPPPPPVIEPATPVPPSTQGATINETQIALEDFFTKSSERPEIYAPNDHTAQLVLPSHTLPNNRYLHEPFRVTKSDGTSRTGHRKARIWEVDMFRGRFNNLDTAGVKSFDLATSNLFRVEKDPRHSRRLTLYFLDAKHPYTLEFASTARRQQFFELAMLMRRNSILWCPSLCLDGENDVTITVKGTTIERPGHRAVPVSGEVKMTVARMPYEVIDLWHGCFSLDGGALPRSTAVFSSFFPKEPREVYVIGVLDAPASLLGTDELARYFSDYLGAATYFVLANTALSPATGQRGNAMLVLCKRSFIVRVANIELLETVSLHKDGVHRDDFTATGCALRINESSIGLILVHARAGAYSMQNRAANIRTLLSSFPFADASVDISVRFDYLVVSGAFHFGGDFSSEDALIREILGDNLMSNMRETEPSPALSSALTPLRIFYAVRPSVSRLDMSCYSTSRALGLANAFFSADIFCQRSFLSLFGEGVPRVQLLLDRVTISGARLPRMGGAELQVSLDAAEGSPSTFQLSPRDGDFVVPTATEVVVCPCVSNTEYLRLQTLTFSVLGSVGPVEAHRRIVVASGVFPLKSVALAEPALLHIPLYYRGCTVGKLTGVLLQVFYERNSAELSALGLRGAKCATLVHCYENQLRRADGAWVAASAEEAEEAGESAVLPFSTEDPAQGQDRESFTVPDPHTWRWMTEWLHDRREDDQEGWVYTDGVGGDLQLSATATTRLRRRRWVRVMQASGPIVYHTYLAARRREAEA